MRYEPVECSNAMPGAHITGVLLVVIRPVIP